MQRAIGARVRAIVQQMLVEALAIGVTGGVLGFGVANVVLRLLVAYAPPGLPRLDEVQLASEPIGVAAAVALFTVLLFGVGPALVAARGDLGSPLRLASRTGGETARRRLVRQVLVASQIALATVMLAGASLLVRSLARLEGQDMGFVSDHLSILWYSWNAQRDHSDSTLASLGDRVVHSIRGIRGVTAATQLIVPPMLGNGVWQVRFEAEGQLAEDASKNPMFPTEMCGQDFFRTLGVPLVRGRTFTDRDDASSPLVAIVSASVARRLWPNQDPIGKRIRVPGAKPENFIGADGWRTIIGVARETHLRTLREASPMVFLPSLQGFWQGLIAIRSTAALTALLPALRAAGLAVDPDVALWQSQTMDEILAPSLAQPRLGALLMSTFGFAALLLAAIGLFGVMAALVRDQTREFGIRMALGATPQRVRADVLLRAGIIAGIGAAVGLVVAFMASRLLTSLLFQVSATDPIALGLACLVLAGVAAAAAYLPARWATTIDPVQALRAD